jgi:hypothetical protein
MINAKRTILHVRPGIRLPIAVKCKTHHGQPMIPRGKAMINAKRTTRHRFRLLLLVVAA